MMEFVPIGNVVDALETGSGVSGVSGVSADSPVSSELSGVSGVSGEKAPGSLFKNLFVKRIKFEENPDDIFPL